MRAISAAKVKSSLLIGPMDGFHENKKGQLRSYPLRKLNGDPTWTRTRDPMVKSHLLYRLSYRTTNRDSTRLVYLNQDSMTDSPMITVWSRSGPVEMSPISTPIWSDRNSTYRRALSGSSSNEVTPKVSLSQPGSVS